MTRQGARAAVAVVALYALVLQAFLTGLLPVGAAQAHGFAELCAPAQDGSGQPARHDGKGCCTAACAPLALPVPDPLAAAAVAWPPRAAIILAFSAAAPPPARGPPVESHSPRGPPRA
jgi:hypothetical protein